MPKLLAPRRQQSCALPARCGRRCGNICSSLWNLLARLRVDCCGCGSVPPSKTPCGCGSVCTSPPRYVWKTDRTNANIKQRTRARHVHLERERAQNTALDADGVRHGWPSHTTARATASHQHTRGWAGIGAGVRGERLARDVCPWTMAAAQNLLSRPASIIEMARWFSCLVELLLRAGTHTASERVSAGTARDESGHRARFAADAT